MSAPAEEEHDSLVQRWLVNLAQAVSRRPLLTVLGAIVLCGACSYYSGTTLRFKTERADLIDPKSDYQRRWVNFAKNFGEIEDMVVVVESDKPAQVTKAMDEIGERMRKQPKHFSDVLYKVDPGSLSQKGLQYLEPGQLEDLLQRLEQFSPVLRGQWDLLSLKSVFQRLNIQLQQGANTPEAQMALGGALHLATSLVHSLDQFAANSRSLSIPVGRSDVAECAGFLAVGAGKISHQRQGNDGVRHGAPETFRHVRRCVRICRSAPQVDCRCAIAGLRHDDRPDRHPRSGMR
ncbi:MAG: hypothetical protein U0903_20060 [Planctomycetales bacterium]